MTPAAKPGTPSGDARCETCGQNYYSESSGASDYHRHKELEGKHRCGVGEAGGVWLPNHTCEEVRALEAENATLKAVAVERLECCGKNEARAKELTDERDIQAAANKQLCAERYTEKELRRVADALTEATARAEKAEAKGDAVVKVVLDAEARMKDHKARRGRELQQSATMLGWSMDKIYGYHQGVTWAVEDILGKLRAALREKP